MDHVHNVRRYATKVSSHLTESFQDFWQWTGRTERFAGGCLGMVSICIGALFTILRHTLKSTGMT